MKTFETEKHNIPEGATHYRNECDAYLFSFVKFDGDDMFVWCDTYWDGVVDEEFNFAVKPIPQTKEVGWDGEGLPPVGVECGVNHDSFVYRVMYSSEYVVVVQSLDNDNTTADGLDIILDMKKGNYIFTKPETKEDREKRERMESAYDLYSAFKVSVGYEPISLAKWSATQPTDAWLAIVDKTGYRKGGE